MADPLDEIKTQLQHARERDQTDTQQHLDRISTSLESLEGDDQPPPADRVLSVVEELDRLEANVDDPAESERIASARERLREQLEDPDRIETAGENEGTDER